MNKVLLFHQFLGGNKKPNFIIQYYATKQIPFLFGKLKKFYTVSPYDTELFGKGELIYDKYDENTNIGEYGLYLDDIVNFYGSFADKNSEDATIIGGVDLCYDLNDNNIVNKIDEDIIVILPNSIEHLLGPVSSGGKVILDSLPENLKSIENYGLNLLKGEGLVIPPTVVSMGKCFNVSSEPVMIDNLYFLSSTPPTLMEDDLGFDGYGFLEDIKLQICIPMEYKEEYLNSDFKIYEDRLNFNKIFKHNKIIKVLDNELIRTVGEFKIYRDNISHIKITGDVDETNDHVILPSTVNILDIAIEGFEYESKYSNILTITGDIKNINNTANVSLFKVYSEIRFVDNCTTIPEGLIGAIIPSGYYDSVWYNKLVIDKNVNNINQIFYEQTENNKEVRLALIVQANNDDEFWNTLCSINYNNGASFKNVKIVELYRNNIDREIQYINLDNITKVNDYAFTNITVSSRQQITLGKNITFIGKEAFKISSGGMVPIYYYGTANDWLKIQMPSTSDTNYENIYSFIRNSKLYVKDDNNVSQNDNFIINNTVDVFNSNFNGFDFRTISINSKIINAKALTDCPNLNTVTLGTNVQTINNFMPASVQTINYSGTIEQWNSITKSEDWYGNVYADVVNCSDGNVTIKE